MATAADRDRFYQLLSDGVNARRAAAGQSPINRTILPLLEEEAAERALEARQQVGLTGGTPIAHPTADQMRARLSWPASEPVGELATWNYLWTDPIRAAVDIRTVSGGLFGLLNSKVHLDVLMNPFWTHWGVGIHSELAPKELWYSQWSTEALETRWYFIIWLSTAPPAAPPPPTPYSGFGTTEGLPKGVRFKGTVTGRQFTQSGTQIRTKVLTWDTESTATASRRALIPGQPGVWLLMANGAYADYWVREGAVRAATD